MISHALNGFVAHDTHIHRVSPHSLRSPAPSKGKGPPKTHQQVSLKSPNSHEVLFIN